nr:putative Se/S carrier-like protein [Clostridium botulinum]
MTKSCGISIKIDEQDYENVKKIIESKEINIKNVYLKEGKDYQLVM